MSKRPYLAYAQLPQKLPRVPGKSLILSAAIPLPLQANRLEANNKAPLNFDTKQSLMQYSSLWCLCLDNRLCTSALSNFLRTYTRSSDHQLQIVSLLQGFASIAISTIQQ